MNVYYGGKTNGVDGINTSYFSSYTGQGTYDIKKKKLLPCLNRKITHKMFMAIRIKMNFSIACKCLASVCQ